MARRRQRERTESLKEEEERKNQVLNEDITLGLGSHILFHFWSYSFPILTFFSQNFLAFNKKILSKIVVLDYN